MDEQIAAKSIDHDESVVSILIEKLESSRVPLIWGDIDVVAVIARLWYSSIMMVVEISIIIQHVHVMGVGLAMHSLSILVHPLSSLRLVPEHHDFSAIRKTFLMMPLRTLPLLQIDQLVDDVFFNEHHHAPGSLFLHTVEFIVSSASDHDRRFFGLCLAGSDQSFVQVLLFD